MRQTPYGNAMRWLIYGANGYTGELVARLAATRGERPVLAGRRAEPVAVLAADLGLDHVVVDLGDEAALRAALDGVDAVAHCAGPFSATAEPMVRACLATGTHYLDVTGEVAVFESIYAQDAAAREAGVVLLPGAGFDVVPTDCLAAMLAAELPDATSLEIAFRVPGGMSPGTWKTSLEGAAAGGLRRVEGKLVESPPGVPSREVPFPSRPRTVGGIRWGDLASGYRSTGIPTITTYTVLPGRPGAAKVLSGPLKRLMRLGPVRKLAGRRTTGPSAETRASTTCEVWVEVRNAAGEARSATLTGPNAYDLTADAVLRAVRRLPEAAPGAHTPSSALGPGFVEELDGVAVQR